MNWKISLKSGDYTKIVLFDTEDKAIKQFDALVEASTCPSLLCNNPSISIRLSFRVNRYSEFRVVKRADV